MIGIGLYEEHNAGIAAVENGRVQLYLEWERLTRIKNQSGWMPDQVAALLADLPLEEVSAICAPRPEAVAALLCEQFGAQRTAGSAVKVGRHEIALLGQDDLHGHFHVWSMLALPGLEPGIYAVLVFDAEQPRVGWIDLREPSVRLPEIRFCHVSEERWFNGELFASFYGKLFYGSRDLSHCGKLMGLGGWGSASLERIAFLRELARESFDPEGSTWQGFNRIAPDTLRGKVQDRWAFDPRQHDLSATLDLAASAQELFRHHLLEQAALGVDQVRRELSAAGLPAPLGLLYSGGCALSVVTNRELPPRTGLPLYVAPYAHDASQFVGAALMASQHGPAARPLPLGVGWKGIPQHTTGLATAGTPPSSHAASTAATPREVARRLARGDLLGLIRGGSEAGPRALGHRSLLANPLVPQIRDHLNHRVKLREWYRPFAAMVREQDFPHYFGERATFGARFMLDSFRLRPAFRELLSSVSSPDGFSRAQVVSPQTDPWLHEVLTEFGALTGHAVILNTSLNAPGLPIAHDLDQALRDCHALGLDAAIVHDALLDLAPTPPSPAERKTPVPVL